jgi:uncharacterized protein YbaR (Trm112 family)
MSDPILKPALQQSDLMWVVCPVCHQSLALDAGFVRCNGCGRRYPIVDNIPVLLPGRAS